MTDTITRTLVDGKTYQRAQQCALDIMWQTKAAVSVDEANRYVLAAIDDGNYDGPMECLSGNLEIRYYPGQTVAFQLWITQEEPMATVTVTRTVSTTYHDTYTVPASLVPKLRDLQPYRVPKAITDEGISEDSTEVVDSDEIETDVTFSV